MLPLLILALLLSTFILWLLAFKRILESDFKNPSNKVPVMLMILMLPVLGTLIFWSLQSSLIVQRKKQVIPPKERQPTPQPPFQNQEQELLNEGWQPLE